MIKKGYVAAYAALLLLFGHMYIYYLILGLPVSDEHIDSVSQMIFPIIGASLVSSVLFVIRQQYTRLSDTDGVNWLFSVFVAVIPTVIIAFIIYGLLSVKSNNDIPDLESTIAVGETFFGGVFVLIVDAVFGERTRTDNTPSSDVRQA